MAATGKFKMNKRTIGHIMKHDGGLSQAVDDVAADVAADAGPNATVDTYTTDRHVGGVVVPAADQARSGTATRAAQGVASRAERPSSTGSPSSGVGFVSRAQWRRAFAVGLAGADEAARASGSYASLPERSSGGGARA